MPRVPHLGWALLLGLALATRLQDALAGPILRGFDAVGHVTYVFFLDVYRALPLADQGWTYFQPPLHYAIGWLLAQLGSAEAFVRALSLWGSAASLGIAALSAAVVRLALPDRRGLALWAFAAVAFLPVHVYASPMPGNELSASLLGVAAIVSHLASQQRPSPHAARDARTGALAGAALLTKYNALIPLLAIAADLGLRALRDPEHRRRTRPLRRLAVIGGSCLLVCGGYYARNVAEFGTPFPMQGHRPAVDAYEAGQPPGQRGWSDLVRVSPRLFADPSPLAPHMIHSIWGSAWAGVWVHLDRHGSNLPPGATRLLLALGVVPSLLAAFGLGLALREMWRRRDAHAEATLALLLAGGLAAFAGFAFATPTFAALKPLYLLSLSPAYAFFVVRALAALGPGWGGAAKAGLAAALGASVWAYTPGLGLPRSGEETVQMAPVHRHFGDLAAAERIYRRELDAILRDPQPGAGGLNRFWARGMLAATWLEAGRPAEARDLYAESFRERPDTPDRGTLGRSSPWVINRAAASAALAGDRPLALGLLDTLDELPAELRVNRAALLALRGEPGAAEAELLRALEEVPDLAPALLDLAWVRERLGEADARAWAERGREASRRAPRGYPYWVGDGRGLNTQIPMLVLRGDGLELYRPARVRTRPAAG